MLTRWLRQPRRIQWGFAQPAAVEETLKSHYRAPRDPPGAPKRPPGTPQRTQQTPKRPQETPKRTQEAPKRFQEASKRHPRVPKRPPETPKRPEGTPKRPPRGTQRHPRGTQEAPRDPKRHPRGFQNGANIDPQTRSKFNTKKRTLLDATRVDFGWFGRPGSIFVDFRLAGLVFAEFRHFSCQEASKSDPGPKKSPKWNPNASQNDPTGGRRTPKRP